jgi:spermidine synthase
MISSRRAASILFLEGLASSGVQMVTLRQTVPFVGSSILCTSIIISCFLGALALGYWCGGKTSPQRFSQSLLRNLVIAIALFGIGLSYPFTRLFFLTVADLTIGVPVLNNPLVHLLAFCLVIMAPLVFLLGQTVPLLLNTADQSTRKSEAAGSATALSTVGNVVGCLLTSLLLMYFLGVGYSILINCLILGVCVLLVLQPGRLTHNRVMVGVSVFSLAIAFVVNVRLPDQLFAATTPYSNIHIAQDETGKRLVINRSSASYIGDTDRKGWPYIEMMKDAIFADDMTGKDVLVLGAGGFTLSAEYDGGANFVYLDIDPTLKSVAETHFLQEKIAGEFIAYDARAYLLTSERQWDIIVVDLYTNAATMPMHTATFEFFSLVSQRLAPTGRAVLNIAANPRLSDTYSETMDNTVRTAFSRCVTDITGYRDGLENIVYLCGKKSTHDRGRVAGLYRDDTTRVTVDGYWAALNGTPKQKSGAEHGR